MPVMYLNHRGKSTPLITHVLHNKPYTLNDEFPSNPINDSFTNMLVPLF